MMESTGTLTSTLLVLVLLLASWVLGYFARGRSLVQRRLPPDPDYFVGLNYLLNDEPDDAIDVFIAALEVTPSTFDTHLALGKLLRRRGKVDRSIEHYQTLLAARSFNAKQTTEIRIQLLRSFISAGLLDRAEQLLLELKQTTSSMRGEALRLAIMLYQIEREWRFALEAATELLKLAPAQHRHDLLVQMTHFHCELAELALRQKDTAAAREELRQALHLFKGNIRVYLLLAQLETAEDSHQEALTLLAKAMQVAPEFFGDVLPALRRALDFAGMGEEAWLTVELVREFENDSNFHIEIARQKLQSEKASVAMQYLLQALGQAPSLALLRQILSLAASEGVMQDEALKAGVGILSLKLQVLPRYRCDNCGFELKNLHWSCPGCSCWGMVKPINNLIVANPDAGMAARME
jgi:lipopolysaccharide biosynthesis regulator YciM